MTVCALNLTQNGSDLMYEVICTDEYVDTKIMPNLRFIVLGAEHLMFKGVFNSAADRH